MRAYIPNCENDYRFPEDMERILNYLNTNGQLNIKPQKVEELYEAYSEDVWCAGWIMVTDESLESFADWLSEVEVD